VKDPVVEAIEVVLGERTDNIDRQIINAILDLQKRHQYDEDEERRVQEMEKLVAEWCDSRVGDSHGD
jgi:hypothetical protein